MQVGGLGRSSNSDVLAKVAFVSLYANVKGMKDLLTFIHGKGHRRIAYIHGADSAVTQSRLSSFYKTAEELDPA